MRGFGGAGAKGGGRELGAGVGTTGRLSTWGGAGMCMETLCTATGVDSQCAHFARRTVVQRAFSQQHGEVGRESGFRGIEMSYVSIYMVIDSAEGLRV